MSTVGVAKSVQNFTYFFLNLLNMDLVAYSQLGGTMTSMKRLTLRLSEALHLALKELSIQEDRSLHGEIVYLLKQMVGNEKHRVPRKESDNAERQ